MSTHPSAIRTPWVLWELQSWDKCSEGSLSPEDGCGTGSCAYWIVPVLPCTGTACRVVSTPMELCHWAVLVWLSPWGHATRAVPTWLSPHSCPPRAVPIRLSPWSCLRGTMSPCLSLYGCPHVIVPMVVITGLCHQGCPHMAIPMWLFPCSCATRALHMLLSPRS